MTRQSSKNSTSNVLEKPNNVVQQNNFSDGQNENSPIIIDDDQQQNVQPIDLQNAIGSWEVIKTPTNDQPNNFLLKNPILTAPNVSSPNINSKPPFMIDQTSTGAINKNRKRKN